MKLIDVFEGCYAASCTANGRKRHAAKVCLTVTSDAATSRSVCAGKGRRSKKREEALLAEGQAVCSELAAEQGGEIFWDRLLYEPRRG